MAVGAQVATPPVSGPIPATSAAPMLREAGGSHFIVGHSEAPRPTTAKPPKRSQAKGPSAGGGPPMARGAGGPVAIICLGETLEEREAGRTLEVGARSLAASVPGLLPSAADTRDRYEAGLIVGPSAPRQRSRTTDDVADCLDDELPARRNCATTGTHSSTRARDSRHALRGSVKRPLRNAASKDLTQTNAGTLATDGTLCLAAPA